MFGMFGPIPCPMPCPMPCPIDKESLKFCAAFALLKRTEEAALSDNDDWKKKESAKIVAGKERDEQLNEIGKEWSRRESVVKKEYKARELKLFRRAAGSLAKIVDGK